MKNSRITIRLEELDREKLEQLVTTGQFMNISQAIRKILKRYFSGGAENSSK